LPEARRTEVAAVLEDAERRFKRARLFFGHGTHNAYDEAAWLMLHTLRAPIDSLDAQLRRTLTLAQARRFETLVRRRIEERTPAAYLLREAWLGPYRFYVDERSIVPRSFIAELLRERLRPLLDAPGRAMDVLDMCTGSGCLAILAALAFRRARVDAVDLSTPALQVARRNLRDYRLQDRVMLHRSDLFAAVKGRTYDLILSNPPYVDASSMRALPPEYRREPDLALGAGRDGLDVVRTILAAAKDFLKPRGLLIVEIGHNRRQLEATFPRLPFLWLEVSAGMDYVFALRREQLE
jgi:ribosomal protein L3 glutamine methyltransferase